MNVCFGKKFIPRMEVGSVLLCKNKGMFIARKLNGEYIANFYEIFDPFHFKWPPLTCFFT
jgi:hypothetical protein